MGGKRTKYISKDNLYMLISHIMSMRSKDPNTQVGCVIVSEDDRILTMGYNGFPNGCSDDDFPWYRDGEEENTKYPYVVHSELNAILNFRGDTKALQGSTLYVTLFPCHECTKAIIQVGIKKIIYESNKYKNTADYREARRMLNAAGVECIQYNLSRDDEIELVKQILDHFHI